MSRVFNNKNKDLKNQILFNKMFGEQQNKYEPTKIQVKHNELNNVRIFEFT